MKLKPCPFCGAIPSIGKEKVVTSDDAWRVVRHYDDCFFYGGDTWFLRPQDKAWNHREKDKS